MTTQKTCKIPNEWPPAPKKFIELQVEGMPDLGLADRLFP